MLGEVIAVRSVVYLALTYDHRLIDGADAARFLATVKNRLEEGASRPSSVSSPGEPVYAGLVAGARQHPASCCLAVPGARYGRAASGRRSE